MVSPERLASWRDANQIDGQQYERLAAIVDQREVSLFGELHALLYAGVLSFIGGLGWTIRTHFAKLGDLAVLVALVLLVMACSIYVVKRAPRWSAILVPSPTFAFDYVLLAGCLAYATGVSYVEMRFGLAGRLWHHYLLVSSALFFALAYRFDNRLVLSLGLTALGGWFGIRLSLDDWADGQWLRMATLTYASILVGAGAMLHRYGIKPHFRNTYYGLAAHLVCMALVWGTVSSPKHLLYLAGLFAACGLTLWWAWHSRMASHAFFATLYLYAGISGACLLRLRAARADIIFYLVYFLVSSSAFCLALFFLHRRFRRLEPAA